MCVLWPSQPIDISNYDISIHNNTSDPRINYPIIGPYLNSQKFQYQKLEIIKSIIFHISP